MGKAEEKASIADGDDALTNADENGPKKTGRKKRAPTRKVKGSPMKEKKSKAPHRRLYFSKNFRCESCGKHFSRSDHVKRHMQLHTGDRPFACEVCDKTFGRRDKLTAHQRTHVGKTR